MKSCFHPHFRRGFTLIEMLCVMAIITILAALFLGPASRILQKARADQWSDRASEDLRATAKQLRRHFGGKTEFPLVTLDQIASRNLVGPSQLRFLRDRRVKFVAFEGDDPNDMVVIAVKLETGFLTEAGLLTETKASITRPPE